MHGVPQMQTLPAANLFASKNSRYAFLRDRCSLPKYLLLQKNLPVHSPGDSQDLLPLGAGSKISQYSLTLIAIHLLTERVLFITLTNLKIAQAFSSIPAALPSCTSLTFRTTLWSITDPVLSVLTVACLWLITIVNGSFFSHSIYFQMSVSSSPLRA